MSRMRPVYKNEVVPDIYGWWRRGYASNWAEKSLKGKDKRKEYLKEDPSTRTWSRPELLEVSKDVEAVWANLRKNASKRTKARGSSTWRSPGSREFLKDLKTDLEGLNEVNVCF
jgi:hypothetical protein